VVQSLYQEALLISTVAYSVHKNTTKRNKPKREHLARQLLKRKQIRSGNPLVKRVLFVRYAKDFPSKELNTNNYTHTT